MIKATGGLVATRPVNLSVVPARFVIDQQLWICLDYVYFQVAVILEEV